MAFKDLIYAGKTSQLEEQLHGKPIENDFCELQYLKSMYNIKSAVRWHSYISDY